MNKVLSFEKKRPGYFYAYAFAFSYSLLFSKNILIEGSAYLYKHNSFLNVIVAILSLCMYLYAYLRREKKFAIYRKQAIIIFGIFMLWLITYTFINNLFSYTYVKEELFEFIVYSFPALIILPYLTTCEDLLNAFYYYRWLVFLFATISVVLMLVNGQIQGSGTRYSVYSMSFGRALMMPTMLFISKCFKDKSKWDFVSVILCILYILIFASRFPLLCIGVFLIVKIVEMPNSKRKYLSLIFSIILFVILYSSFNHIVDKLNDFLLLLGINSRSLSLITQGTFDYDSGRLVIIKQLIEGINDSPVIGFGAGGGNRILNNGISHSFIFDVFANLGYIGGSVFLIISFYQIVNLYMINKSSINREFIIICMCMFFPICIFQMSMWRAYSFWILIALNSGRLNPLLGVAYNEKD